MVDGRLLVPAQKLVVVGFRPGLAPTLHLRMAVPIVEALQFKHATWHPVQVVLVVCVGVSSVSSSQHLIYKWITNNHSRSFKHS